MDRRRINIAIIEPSQLIFEGFSNIAARLGSNISITRFPGLSELSASARSKEISVAIVNPSILQNRLNEFSKVKREFPGILWLAMVYNLYGSELLEKFDDTLNISDSADLIAAKITSERSGEPNDKTGEVLSVRETDVLREMIRGKSNKEIADVLNISIHTVITHRKNITEKTGIKSLPGLTIYAITKKLVPVSSFSEHLK